MTRNIELLDNINAVKKIIQEAKELFNSDSGYYSIEKETDIKQQVEDLLNFEKPKIIITGIYSAGKSTLVNVLCRKNIAEVSAKPQTDKITEYNYNDFILVDSPGVDAPIKHEKITDEYVSKCHVLLFVISTGNFESITNFSKLYSWIKNGNPFIIVINDKTSQISLDSDEIITIKNKIVENLRKVGADNDIINKYDVIAVNAKRASIGIFENKPKMYELSNIKYLEERIVSLMSQRNMLKLMITPLNNLTEMLDEFEKIQTNKAISANDNGDYVSELQKKRIFLTDDIKISVRNIIESKKNTLISACIGGKDISGEILSNIYKELEQLYKIKISDLKLFVGKFFKDADIAINSADICFNGKTININITKRENVKPDVSTSTNNNLSENNETMSTAINTADKITGGGSHLPTIFEIGKQLLEMLTNNSHKKEEQEFQNLLAEADIKNKESEQRANEELRRIQDIRMNVEVELDRLTNEFSQILSDTVCNCADSVINQLVELSEENETLKKDIENKIKTAQRLKSNLAAIKNIIN